MQVDGLAVYTSSATDVVRRMLALRGSGGLGMPRTTLGVRIVLRVCRITIRLLGRYEVTVPTTEQY